MTLPRFLPDWAIYAVLVAVLVVAALIWREKADAPEAPPPIPGSEGGVVGAASVFDPAIVVRTPPATAHAAGGTAFSVSKAGVWLTARHAIEGCRKVAVMVNPGSGVVADVHTDGAGDVAVLTTLGGPPGLPLSLTGPLHIGERGFHPGYPQGAPGEITTRLLGRQTLVMRWPKRLRGAHAEEVVGWAETGRTDGLRGDLAGLSGAPVFDANGYVVGLTLAETTRRARLYTADPATLLKALKRLHVQPGEADRAKPQPFTVDNYGRVSDAMRRDLSIAPVRCVS